MTNLTRVKQEIFAVDAGTEERAQIGSIASGFPAFTTDPTTIQALANFKQGLFGVCIGENSPALEDINSLYYLMTYQLAYLMQKGVPEYHSGTEYYIGSIVSQGGYLYRSLVNNNIANPVTNTTMWESVDNPAFKSRFQHSLLRGWTYANVYDTDELSLKPGNIRNFAWSPSLKKYVGVGANYSGTMTNKLNVKVSLDGHYWKAITSNDTNEWYDVCWSPELSKFVAISGANNVNNIRTSPDGETWTTQTQATMGFWRRIIWCAGISKFIMVGGTSDNTKSIATSPDGITWTTRTTSAGESFANVAWSPELGLIIAVGRDRAVKSTDGVTWTDITVPLAGGTAVMYDKVVWSKKANKFIIMGTEIGGASTKCSTSPDGATWSSFDLPTYAKFKEYGSGEGSIVWIDDLEMFVASSAYEQIYSIDYGVTWLKGIQCGQNRLFYNPELKQLLKGGFTDGNGDTFYGSSTPVIVFN